MKRTQDYGYTTHNYEVQVGDIKPKVLTAEKPWKRREKDEKTGKRTGKELNTVITCYYPGLGLQLVYLPVAFEMPKEINDLEDIELINPTGYFGSFNNFYVKADGIRKGSEK